VDDSSNRARAVFDFTVAFDAGHADGAARRATLERFITALGAQLGH
jgi:hypothetical protein